MSIETQRQLLARALDAQQEKLNRSSAAAGKRKSELTAYTYSDLATDLGISRQAISQFRRGSPISNDLAIRIASITGDELPYVMAIKEYAKEIQKDDPSQDTLNAFMKMARTYKRSTD